jgi:PBP4 family serine-type D-alanyl-D-alanine carboxypeptidase
MTHRRSYAPLLFLFCTLVFLPPYAAADLAAKLAEAIDSSPVSSRTHVAMHVINVETGEELFNRQASLLFTPASNMKLYSSAAALQQFGPQHRFETIVGAAEAPVDGSVSQLYLRALGNPVLSGNDLRELARRVRHELKIERVEGDLVLDLSLFNSPLKGPGWAWDDDPDTYNMSVTPLMVDYNVLTVSVVPTEVGNWPEVSMALPAEHPPLVNLATTVEGEGTSITIQRRPFDNVIIISGEIGKRSQPYQQSLTMHDPAAWAGSVFLSMLREEKVNVRGGVSISDDSPELAVKIVHPSAPLSQILPLFNKPSENAIGEMLIHHLAIAAGESPANWSRGARVLDRWLTDTVGIPEDAVRVADGSGLSRYNMITAEGTTKLLRFMWYSPHRQVYVDSLPVAGVDGSLSGRMGNSAAEQNVFAKTGTMTGVSCLSGYAGTEAGTWLAFSILTNGFTGSSGPSRDLQDALCVILVENSD